ncbi:MAG: TonB family protein [Arenimonas sp.]|nr:TonB family protein [Arenimonas sp.]
MTRVNRFPLSLRWAIALALGLGLAACSKSPAPAATAPAAAKAAADQAANQAAQQAAQQAAALAALSVDELKSRGRQALREQRIYSPAGNNAMEYYLALRKKSDKPDASAESALMDLQPYAVIAAEQAITRQDFIEAERLRSLIAAADPQAPSLTRIGDAIAKGQSLAAQQLAVDATRTADQAKAAEAAKLKAAQDALAAQTAPIATEALPTTTPVTPAPAPQTQAQAPAPVEAAPPPRPIPAPAAPAPAPARAAGDLVAVSTPQPVYPPDAKRAGTAGQVVVSFTVNTDGSVSDIDIVSARPRGVFERNVQSAVRRWQFEPISGPQTVTRTFDFAR